MATRIAACWRRGELYVLRDVDGREITDAEGRKICAERYKVTAEVRAARRRAGAAQSLKKRTGRGSKESTKATPASDPPGGHAIRSNRVA
jgi:hypothetical protein